MEIRRLGAGDEISAVRIIENLKFPMDGITDTPVDPVYLPAFLADDRHYLLAAFLGEEAVGYLFGYRLDRFDGQPPSMFLYEIGIIEQHRRKGIGRALVEEFKCLAKADGCRKIFVPTERSNKAAMALYRSTGGKEGAADATAFWWNW